MAAHVWPEFSAAVLRCPWAIVKSPEGAYFLLADAESWMSRMTTATTTKGSAGCMGITYIQVILAREQLDRQLDS